jgi:hypothetical protein
VWVACFIGRRGFAYSETLFALILSLHLHNYPFSIEINYEQKKN